MPADPLSPLGAWLLTYLLHSTLLLGGVWLATLARPRAPAFRDLLWKAALLGGFATSTLQAATGFEPVGGMVSLGLNERRPIPGPGVTGETATTSAVPAPDTWRGLIRVPAPSPTQAAPADRAVGPLVPGGSAPHHASEPGISEVPARSAIGWPSAAIPMLLLGWLVIALGLVGLYLVQRAVAFRRIGVRSQVSDVALLEMLEGLCRAAGVRRRIRLTSAPGLTSPVALDRDEIALPEAALTDLDRDQQRSMLAHELAHLERRDPAWLALGCVIERAFFFQPFNRLARIRIQEAAEYLCDDWAVHRTGSGISLATCLVKVAEWVGPQPRPVPLAGMAEHRSQLVARIHRLIEGRAMPHSVRSFWLLAGAVALIGVTAVVAPGITTGGTDLVAQGVVAPASAAEPDSANSWYRRLAREMSVARSRARLDLNRSRLLARRELMVARGAALAPPAPLPPMVPMPPSVAAVARAPLADFFREGERRRDTTGIAVPALMAALKDADVEVRRAAAQSLANHQDPRSIPALIDALRDGDPEVRGAAASALGQFEDKRAVPGLVALLKDSNKDVRHAGLSALSGFRDMVPTEAILTALNDADSDIKVAAMGLATSCECDEEHPADPRIVQAVVALISHPKVEVRAQAIGSLSSFGLREAPAGLLQAGKDKNPEVRAQVASALGSTHDPRAVAVLKELLQDSNAEVREIAISGLSEIRDRSALEALVAALKSSDPVVRRRAAEALGQRQDEGW